MISNTMIMQECRVCQVQFQIPDEDKSLYQKLDVSFPRECFKCRIEHLYGFWLFGKFRKGKSDLSGKDLITTLPENARYPIYTYQEWYSDTWELPALIYNPEKSFLAQLKELQEQVPRPHQDASNNVDCDWSTDIFDSKNCYLCRAIINGENLSYCLRVFQSKDSIDLTYCYRCEQSYDLTYCFDCYNVRHSFNVRGCLNSAFLFDCRNVQDSFMCWNLRNKQFHILNQPYSKEEYQEKIKEFQFGSRAALKKLREQFQEAIRTEAWHRANFNMRVENSTGNYLTNCNDCQNCFLFEDSEECRNMVRGLQAKSCIDCIGTGGQSERCGRSVAAYPSCYNVKYSLWTNNCRDSEYLDTCIDCSDCFGCIGLKKKKFCILNTQYTEEEYRRLKEKIIQSMKTEGVYGEFLPLSFAPGGYNLSTATLLFDRTREDVEKIGGVWEEVVSGGEGMDPRELVDDIKEAADEITSQALLCPRTNYRFNIAPAELDFYKRKNIPLPEYHPDFRNKERFRSFAVLDSYQATCGVCRKEITTFYPPELGYQKIACIECYQKTIE